MKKTLMTSAVILFAVFVYAQGKNGVTQTANEEYKSQEHVTQTAKSVIVDKEKKHNRVGIAGKDDVREIYFEDKKGNKIKSIKLGHISLGKRKLKSENGAVEEVNVIENVTGDVFKDGSGAVIAKHKLSYNIEDDNVLEVERLDENGEKKWKKEIGANRVLGSDKGRKLEVANNGFIVFLVGDNDEYESNAAIYVYDSSGKEILCYPDNSDDRADKIINRYQISPNGRYLGIEYRGKKSSVVFFDLENGKSWDVDEKWAIDSISDNGIINLYFKSKTKKIDLNEKR
ncbi:MAG TPA: hypothetical protein PLB12_10215 [Candidatus Goldiibacteriota bacterium]|nr:hypothetical protein [Candidatus Goldiibacteriota bacterium]HRQ44705.1 hypothetical protein [Candidatus Goldiibacteriota bacterium]